MRILEVESTDLFTEGPRQVIRVRLADPVPGAAVRVTGEGVTGTALVGDSEHVEVPVDAGHPAGARVPVTVSAGEAEAAGELVVAEPGWTVWMVAHFHYDPVWWNTQAAYTATWDHAGEAAQRNRNDFQHAGFELVKLHLETARREPEYKFVLAEVDYLKPFWDAHPEHRTYLRRLLAEGRVEIMGGTYNEPNTNLTGAELTIRNFVHGLGFQRDVLGGDPRTAWQLDAFGHDPQFPGLVAEAGLDSSSWARGPYHQWGPMLGGGDPARMQFPAEFAWVSPSGRGVLTHYMPGHYSAGWWMDSATSLGQAEAEVYRLFLALKKVASTRNVLLPVGTDYSPPNKWIMEIQRDWNTRYVSPRVVCGLPREFFAAVRAELPEPLPQTRDMNPVYTGKDVSFIDTKQAQRHAESQLIDAEKLATLAAITTGTPYPYALLDKAWRQLVYGAHHDAITGSESDQVYLDLLTGWREAHDLGATVLTTSLAALSPDGVTVWNPSSWPRTDLVRVNITFPPGWYGVAGKVLLENAQHHPDGSLRSADLTFLAEDVPAFGYLTFSFTPGEAAGWAFRDGTRIENATHVVEVDPARGGGVTSLRVRGRELLQPGRVGNEIVVHDEYPAHPKFHEGPWHLVPKGTSVGSGQTTAAVEVAECAIGRRLVVTGQAGPVAYRQEITLWDGLDRVDLITHADFDGSDQLLRLRWPVHAPGALPVSEVGAAVVGRGFALIEADSAAHPWTLDNPCDKWFALSTTCRIGTRPIGVAEIVFGEGTSPGQLRELASALVRQGVTATCSPASGPRYGNLAVDSNLPDVRIAIGTPEDNPFVAALLDGEALAGDRVWVSAETPLQEAWTPSANLAGPRALPVLVVAGPGAVDALIEDLADGVVEADTPGESFDDYTIGLINRGIPGFAVEPDGSLNVSLMRSCTGWPSGIWIDPPRRTTPDGSNFQLQHWTHTFECALIAAPGDWRAADLVRHGHDVNHPLLPHVRGLTGPQRSHSYLSTEPGVVLAAMKAAGNPIASGRRPAGVEGVTLRLYEALGREVSAYITAAFGGRQAGDVPGRRVTAASGSGRREDAPGRGVSAEVALGGWLRADLRESVVSPAPRRLTGMEIATLTASLTPSSPAASPAKEPHQPVFTRYWLHNTGPAPLGNMPVALHLSAADLSIADLSIAAGHPEGLNFSIASGLTEDTAEGVVTLVGPDGWLVEPAVRPYALPPGGHATVPIRVTPPPGVRDGLYWLRARTAFDGQEYEDVTRVHVGGTQPVGLDVSTSGTLVLSPGEEAEFVVRLRGHALTPVSAQVQLISPWPTYGMFPVWNTGTEIPAAGEAEVRFPVMAGRPGRWWALAKVACAGWLHYTETIGVEVRA
ncbi:NEW3 domain-containing protein [Acrocarpospora catenulata]|uniref:glycoside hydrolase family 38 N-terminal domain-containing protein n=1 Tax=Acrocarpospora catenulata TaxID=2836182 RepID=UPI001BD9B008|nr:NEW3 domain-containing protein [Acrocarpospora catenulata]